MRTLKRLVRRSSLLRACKTITRRKQSTVAERISQIFQEEPTPFRCPGPHSPSRVEGVAGTIAIGRRLRHSESNSGMSCGESLVSSITQEDFLCLRGLFSTLSRVGVADNTIRILAEPSNNSNSAAWRQPFWRTIQEIRRQSHCCTNSVANWLRASLSG